ncbi:GvpL/GvpF family gas vesicle protein [Streptomyces sp. NBC_00236]|uniref:GvpL/GvpF family gas vesicle protein n=1 Tax=Streptomyces sp. NBC_00236 TaxID=2903639 RepID=UPI002E2E805F|nr:GvpL/GvpF family gas vesicle protein [Streptomyces sp. NBC_00236]
MASPMTVTPHHPQGSTDRISSAATYVFAVCRADHPGNFASASRGHAAGGPLRLLTVGGVCAVVQDVPAAEFSEAALRDRLADAAELERCARTHHEVVTAAASVGPTVPLPLATLYLDDERAGTALRENQDRFGAVLERITGRAEWAVKVYMTHPETLARSAVPAPPEKPPPNTQPGPQQRSGRAYMNRLRGRQQLRESQREAALAAGERVGSALRELAVGTVQRRPHGPEVTGKDRTQVMNAACLIADDRIEELTTTIRRLRASPEFKGIEIDVCGPWAPYSFTDGGDLAQHR